MEENVGKREQILQVATELFLRLGYKKTTLDDIANKLEIQKGGIYYYFKSKKELFHEVLKLQHEDYKTFTLKSLEGTADFRECLMAYVKSKLDYILDHTEDKIGLPGELISRAGVETQLIHDFRKWEQEVIDEKIVSLATKVTDEKEKMEIGALIDIEIGIVANIFNNGENHLYMKEMACNHLACFITGIESKFDIGDRN